MILATNKVPMLTHIPQHASVDVQHTVTQSCVNTEVHWYTHTVCLQDMYCRCHTILAAMYIWSAGRLGSQDLSFYFVVSRLINKLSLIFNYLSTSSGTFTSALGWIFLVGVVHTLATVCVCVFWHKPQAYQLYNCTSTGSTVHTFRKLWKKNSKLITISAQCIPDEIRMDDQDGMVVNENYRQSNLTSSYKFHEALSNLTWQSAILVESAVVSGDR